MERSFFKSWAVGVVAILVVSSMGLIYFGYQESLRGGMAEKWSTPTDANGVSSPRLQYISNGTIFGYGEGARAVDGRHYGYLFAMDLNGSILWKAGVNAQPGITLGPDGSYYYVDWQDVSIWQNDSSLAGWYNITALNSDGTFRWDYVVDKGQLEILAISPDGMVAARYINNHYDRVNMTWITESHKVIAIDQNGEELWRTVLPLEANHSFARSQFLPNGSFAITAYNSSDAYDIVFNWSNGSTTLEPVQFHQEHPSGGTNPDGTVKYEVMEEVVDYDNCVISAYAINMSDGTVVWRTVLKYTANDEHNAPNSGYMVGGTRVDGNGVIFCGDFSGKMSYGLDQGGTILWQKDVGLVCVDAYPTGGFLVIEDDEHLKRIGSNGDIVWRHYAKGAHFGYTVLLGSDGTIYYPTESSVVAVAASAAMSPNALAIIVIVVVDAALLAGYGIDRWYRRKRRT